MLKKYALITISIKYEPKGPVSIKPAFFQILTWHRTGGQAIIGINRP